MPVTSLLAASVLATSTGSTGGGKSSLVSFLPLILIVAVGYFLLIRPARARQRRAAETRGSAEPGAEVTTTAGLIATVVAVDGDIVTLEVAPGVHSRYLKGAIARVNSPLSDEDDEGDDDTDGSASSVDEMNGYAEDPTSTPPTAATPGRGPVDSAGTTSAAGTLSPEPTAAPLDAPETGTTGL